MGGLPRLYVRQGDRLVEASEEDRVVAGRYSSWPDKGQIVDGKRLTILTGTTSCAVNDEVRVVHVFEAGTLGLPVYVMGPKPVYGEYVDGELATESPRNQERPWDPEFYAGATLPSPAVDYNYEITSYRFAVPGAHSILWDLGQLQSNRLTIEVTEPASDPERDQEQI